MAIIKKLNITEFKVVSYFTEPGIQEESTGNSWMLDEKTSNRPFGTDDFNGVARTSVLLAKLESITLNVGKYTFNQFQQLQPNVLAQFYSVKQDIGWVEIGRSVASIYYEDCSKIEQEDVKTKGLTIPGRLPVSKNYFDLDALTIPWINQSIPIVSGEGFGQQAVQVIEMYNPAAGLVTGRDVWSFGPDPIFYPQMPLIGPNEYIPLIVTNDGVSRVPGQGGPSDVVTLKANTYPVSLRIISRYEIETESDPNYVGIDSDTSEYPDSIKYDDGKKLRWGKQRRILTNAFPADITGPVKGFGNENMWEATKNNRTVGECVLYPDRATFVDTGVNQEEDGILDGGEIYPDLTPDPPMKDDLPFCEGCPPFYKIPINFPPLDVVERNEREGNYFSFSGATQTFDPNITIPGYVQDPIEDNSNMLRSFHQSLESGTTIRDPREFGLDIKSSPAGYFHVLFNKKTCSFDVFPALRDKDGDIPEPIGPTVAYYMEDIRRQISQRFYLPQEDSVLKTLSTGSDGYLRFSDGKSYKELLGESVLGCGDYFSFDRIPEVFVELYPVSERQEVRDYRMTIERPTKIPWPLPKPERTHDQNYIADIVKDLTIGIPDADIVNTRRSGILVQDKYISALDGDGLWGFPIHTIVPDYLRAHTPGFWYDPTWYTDMEIDGGILGKDTNIYFLPSRWKSTIRPIYDAIYEDKDSLKDPRWSKYISYDWYLDIDGKRVNKSGTRYLGKMESLPWKDTPWKDPNTLGDYEFRSKITDGYGKIIYDVLDEAISDRVFFDEDTVNSRQSNSLFDYLQFGRIYHHFADSLNTPLKGWRVENVVNLVNSGREIYHILKHPESLIESTVRDIVVFLLTEIYSAISYEYSRKNTERTSLSPLRTFKKGGIILQSKTGYYFNDKEPCPIIFLGFNDGKKIRTGIENLVKNDEEDTFYFKSSNRYFINAARPKMIHSMPSMKKRVKQYGINPLLEIFHLNIAEKSKENPGISPFRPGPSNEVMGGKSNWPDFSKGQYPYMFPPMWNEPSNAPNTPSMDELGLKDGAQWGDLAWRKRRPNTIIPLKDRWSLSIDKDSDGVAYAILTDKTPILDIYNMLMEMHVKGVSWGEIQNYINRTKSAVSGVKYKEKINLDILEDISRELQIKLNSKDNEILSEISGEDLPSISIQPINWGILQFKENRNEVLIADIVFKSPNTNRRIYINDVFIESDEINGTRDTYDNLSSDLFELGLVGGFNYSQSGLEAIPLADSINRNIPLSQNELYKFSVKFKNGTSNLSVQPMFEYSANVIISYSLDSPDGEQFESSTTLTAMVSTDRKITTTEESYYFEPIITQNVIEFDFVEESNTVTQTILFNNYSDTDSVKIVSAKLEEMIMYVNVNGFITPITSKLFDSGKPDIFFEIKNFFPTEIPPTKLNETVKPYEITVSFKPDTETSYNLKSGDGVYYYGKMIVNYEHSNVGKSKRTTKSIEIPISGYTSKK